LAADDIFITEYDAQRLRALLSGSGIPEGTEADSVDNLRHELSRAKILAPRDIPPDVVTMNSRVCLVDLETGDEEAFTLAFPDDADVEQGRISVLAPVGIAMLGYRTGDVFTWKVPKGECRFRIKEISFQPEASGNFEL